MNTFALILACTFGGAILALTSVAFVVFAWPHLTRRHAPDWLCKLRGEPTWAKPCRGSVTNGSTKEAEWVAVSRHDPAEAALVCPLCQTEVAPAGDFRRVQRAIIDGVENEVMKCPGIIQDDPSRAPRNCKAFLVASPDTEHGDHLDAEGNIDVTSELTPEMHRFKRSTSEQILRERWGADLGGTPEAIEIPESARPEGAESKPDIVDVPVEVAVAMQMGLVGGTDPKYTNLKPKE